MSEGQVRTALITGGASGIGRAAVLRMAADGVRVLVADLDAEAANRVAREVQSAGGRARSIELDVCQIEQWRIAVATEPEPIDVLVNCAGFTRDKTILKMTEAEWDAVVGVHLKSILFGCQAIIPGMKDAGGGAIVNVSSDARHGAFGQANYSAAKAGVVALTKTIALEHARHGIRANVVAPGPVDTPMLNDVPDAVKEEWLRLIPLSRLATPSEVAAAISFLASEDASYITGHVLAVDGGATQP